MGHLAYVLIIIQNEVFIHFLAALGFKFLHLIGRNRYQIKPILLQLFLVLGIL